VVGAARSGTTLLRLMLDAHPALAIPSETGFVPQLIDAGRRPGASPEALAALLVEHRRFADFGFEPAEVHELFARVEPFNAPDALRAFFGAYAERQGKSRWGDKTPAYALRMRDIGRALPEVRFVHVIRDGRDVRLSQMGRGESPPSAAKHARRWRRRVRAAQRQGRSLPYLEVRFEDLVTDTEAELRRVCELIELDYEPAMLAYHERATDRLPASELRAHLRTAEPPSPERIGRWRREMPPEDLAEFNRVAGSLLEELGYDVAEPSGRTLVTA